MSELSMVVGESAQNKLRFQHSSVTDEYRIILLYVWDMGHDRTKVVTKNV